MVSRGGVLLVAAGGRPAFGGRPETALEALVGARFAADVEAGLAPFQQDSDGWGVASLVDRRRPAAFTCDQEVVLRQAMADHGWEAPQFVAGRSLAERDGVDVPRHSLMQAVGGSVSESGYRRVWHVSVAGVPPVPRRSGISDPASGAELVRRVAAGAGVRLIEGGAVAVVPTVAERALASVVSYPRFAEDGSTGWAVGALRAVVDALARSRLVNQVVQLFAFERFLVRALRAGTRAARRAVLAWAYWAVAESLGRVHSVTLAPGTAPRVMYEASTRTLALDGRGKGVGRSLGAMFAVAEVCADPRVRAAAERRDPVALLRLAGVGGPISHPERSDPLDWDARAELVAAMAAKRAAERLGLRYVAPPLSGDFVAGTLRVLDGEGWRSVAIEAGNLAAWLVDGGRGRGFWPAALE